MDAIHIPLIPYYPCAFGVVIDPMMQQQQQQLQNRPIIAERFKTKMCANYERTGVCPYEVRCMFAHGEHELRTKEMNMQDHLVTEEAVKHFQRARMIAARTERKRAKLDAKRAALAAAAVDAAERDAAEDGGEVAEQQQQQQQQQQQLHEFYHDDHRDQELPSVTAASPVRQKPSSLSVPALSIIAAHATKGATGESPFMLPTPGIASGTLRSPLTLSPCPQRSPRSPCSPTPRSPSGRPRSPADGVVTPDGRFRHDPYSASNLEHPDALSATNTPILSAMSRNQPQFNVALPSAPSSSNCFSCRHTPLKIVSPLAEVMSKRSPNGSVLGGCPQCSTEGREKSFADSSATAGVIAD
jgi:hypothetical protein